MPFFNPRGVHRVLFGSRDHGDICLNGWGLKPVLGRRTAGTVNRALVNGIWTLNEFLYSHIDSYHLCRHTVALGASRDPDSHFLVSLDDESAGAAALCSPASGAIRPHCDV